MIDAVTRQRAQIDTGDVDVVEPAAIDEHQRIVGRGRAEAAHVHHALGAVHASGEAAHLDAGLAREQILDRLAGVALDVGRRDDRRRCAGDGCPGGDPRGKLDVDVAGSGRGGFCNRRACR
jgi:hypothetical protein